jgi:hypothetical protein
MDLDDTLGDELAGLEVMRHLALGSAHTLNNALTAILGEVQLLAEDCGDRDVGAACTSIRREVERCARLTRALCECGARRGREPALDPQVDLAALARRLAPLLRDTVSRGVDIDWQLPDDAGPVYGDRTDVERLVLLSAYRLVRGAPSGASLRIALDPSTQPPELAFELRAPAGQRTTSSVWDRVVAQTAQRLADRNQIGIESREMGDAIRLRFAAAGDEAAD